MFQILNGGFILAYALNLLWDSGSTCIVNERQREPVNPGLAQTGVDTDMTAIYKGVIAWGTLNHVLLALFVALFDEAVFEPAFEGLFPLLVFQLFL